MFFATFRVVGLVNLLVGGVGSPDFEGFQCV